MPYNAIFVICRHQNCAIMGKIILLLSFSITFFVACLLFFLGGNNAIEIDYQLVSLTLFGISGLLFITLVLTKRKPY